MSRTVVSLVSVVRMHTFEKLQIKWKINMSFIGPFTSLNIYSLLVSNQALPSAGIGNGAGHP